MDADDIPDPEPLPELDDTQIQPTNNQFELRLLSQVNKWAALDSFSFEPNEQVVCWLCCGHCYCLLLAVLRLLLAVLRLLLLTAAGCAAATATVCCWLRCGCCYCLLLAVLLLLSMLLSMLLSVCAASTYN